MRRRNRKVNKHSRFTAACASLAVEYVDLDPEFVVFESFALCLCCSARSVFCFFCCKEERSDSSVRANQRALVTSDTFIYIPYRNFFCNTTFVELSCVCEEDTISIFFEFAYRQIVTNEVVHRVLQFSCVFRQTHVYFLRLIFEVSPCRVNFYFVNVSDTSVN